MHEKYGKYGESEYYVKRSDGSYREATKAEKAKFDAKNERALRRMLDNVRLSH